MGFSAVEILTILLLALILFGPQKLPEVSRQVGGALRELRRVQHQVSAEINSALEHPPPDAPPPRSGAPGAGSRPPAEPAGTPGEDPGARREPPAPSDSFD